MRVLVTGGAGFLGSHVVDALLARGDEVTVVDDLSTGARANVDRHADFAVADVADLSSLQRGIGSRRIDAVIHCAALIVVPDSVADPIAYYRANVAKTLDLVETLAQRGIDRFIFSSSASNGRMPAPATRRPSSRIIDRPR